MTVRKFTLLYAAALLLMVPAKALPINPAIVKQPTKLLPPRIDGPIIATEPPYYLKRPLPKYQMPMEYQKRHLPPAEYDHDYDGELIILRTLEPQVFRACRQIMKPSQQPLGCSQRTPPRKCTIWIVTDEELRERGWDYNIILRHEIGHCNGWRHPY